MRLLNNSNIHKGRYFSVIMRSHSEDFFDNFDYMSRSLGLASGRLIFNAFRVSTNTFIVQLQLRRSDHPHALAVPRPLGHRPLGDTLV